VSDPSDDLLQEVAEIIRANADRMSESTKQDHDEGFWHHAGLSISLLLWDDLLGDVTLPDATVARLWEIGYALGYDGVFLVSDAGLEKARDGRRTRPPEPMRFPLKGGGHGAGRGIPGKSEYPATWTDNKTTAAFMSVAREPDGAVAQPNGTFRAWGVRDGVDMRVLVTGEGDVVTAYPVSGEGVVHNPLDDVRTPLVARLADLVAATPLDETARTGVDEQMRVGEWDQVLLVLHAVGVPEGRQPDLDELSQLADL